MKGERKEKNQTELKIAEPFLIRRRLQMPDYVYKHGGFKVKSG